MTKEELAAELNGSEYPLNIHPALAAKAKASGLLVIYGASDDLLEFDGAFQDETGAYGGTTVLIDQEGIIPSWGSIEGSSEDEALRYFTRKPNGKGVRAEWDKDGYSWIIETDIPHATFEILEAGEKYCRGIVLSLADIENNRQEKQSEDFGTWINTVPEDERDTLCLFDAWKAADEFRRS